jgi:hypothetical protein
MWTNGKATKNSGNEIGLTTHEKIVERHLLRVRKARTPLEEVMFPSPLEADREVGRSGASVKQPIRFSRIQDE